MEDAHNVQTLILDQLRSIAAEVKPIPQLQAKLNALDTSTREMVAELRARDESHARAIEEMRLRQSEILAALAGVSSTLSEQKNELLEQGRRLQRAEDQVKATFDSQLETGRRLRDVSKDVDDLSDQVAELADPPELQKLAGEIAENRPWMNGIKWFARILFGLLATAMGAGLLWLLAKAISGSLGA